MPGYSQEDRYFSEIDRRIEIVLGWMVGLGTVLGWIEGPGTVLSEKAVLGTVLEDQVQSWSGVLDIVLG